MRVRAMTHWVAELSRGTREEPRAGLERSEGRTEEGRRRRTSAEEGSTPLASVHTEAGTRFDIAAGRPEAGGEGEDLRRGREAVVRSRTAHGLVLRLCHRISAILAQRQKLLTSAGYRCGRSGL
jgi:hypothetical protein